MKKAHTHTHTHIADTNRRQQKNSPQCQSPSPTRITTKEGDSDDDSLNAVDTKWERAVTMPPAIGVRVEGLVRGPPCPHQALAWVKSGP